MDSMPTGGFHERDSSERKTRMAGLLVVGISSSPRADGNTDLLLREALAGAESAGARCEHISLRGLTIAPCVECNACFKTGV